METESRISYEDMVGLVQAMSEVVGRLVPGMSLSYRERRLRRSSMESADLKELAVVRICPDGNEISVRGAIVEIGYEQYGEEEAAAALGNRRLAEGVVPGGDEDQTGCSRGWRL